MSTRHAKQMIYGALYVVLWVLFFGIIYFAFKLLAPAPAVVAQCTSDCMPVGADSITTSTIGSFITSPGHYTFLDQITNTNATYAASYFDYSIDLYDASGTVVQSIPGTSFIYPNQTKYLVAPNQTVDGTDPVVAAGITIKNVYWVSDDTLGVLPQFNIQNVQTTLSSTTVSVSGQITNNDISDLKYVFVDVIFKGPDGSPVGASQTEINNVNANQTVNFSVIYPNLPNFNAANNQVLVYGIRD